MGERGMTDYYANRLQAGLEFQDFVADAIFNELFIPITTYQSAKYQLKGENKQGIEIKFDDKHAQTGNLYIETSEKSHPDNPSYVDSGIYRSDNTWLYVIGNYSVLYIFGKHTLVMLHKSEKFREVTTPTSTGFLIPADDAKRFCLKILSFNPQFGVKP